MSKTSRYWPYIRAIAKVLTIPGTKIGLEILTDIQDQLSADEAQRELNEALATILNRIDEIVDRLKSEEDLEVSAQALSEAALQIAEAIYLKQVAEKYFYADFKGIEQMEKLVSLELDDVFVNLKVRPERSASERYVPERESLRELPGTGTGDWEDEQSDDWEDSESSTSEDLEQRLARLDAERLRTAKGAGQPVPIDSALQRGGGLVMLGGPGSGKTTLVKRLARSCALGPDALKERYGKMPWCFPVVVPITVFDDRRDHQGIYEFVKAHLKNLGGKALVAAFEDYWAAGQCLLLLDGLDEVADTGRRIGCARAVGQLLKQHADNRILVTSRPVGYNICRISVPCEHVQLEPFDRTDIEQFARNWYLAYDRAVHPEHPDPKQAQNDADELIKEIENNPRVESLATNPLMLTIIALIKQQNVTLPERRVQLYDIVLNTLIRSWNLARSLANRPVGEQLNAEETKKVWAAVAYWMHSEKSTGTCPRGQLQDRLVKVLIDIGKDELEAEQLAEAYIDAAAERAGLLEERGAGIFAFMHQTFQEYLAARFLAKPHSKVIERVLQLAPDPRWHEVIRLTAGYIGVIQEDDEMVTELVMAIANHNGGPLEPYMCTSLRLAASCLADQVRVKPPEANRVVIEICRRLKTVQYGQVVSSLGEALKSLRQHQPNAEAVEALIELCNQEAWYSRVEAARMLSRVADRNPEAADCLRETFKSCDNEYVKAHAALGLWRAGSRDDLSVLEAIAHGLTSRVSEMQLGPEPELLAGMRELLKAPNAHVRFNAIRVLASWGQQATALPTLLELLEDQDLNVRSKAVGVLGGWGHQAEFVPTLLGLLDDQNSMVRLSAAVVLRGWGLQAEAVTALLGLLKDQSSFTRLTAATVVLNWDDAAEFVPTLLGLLDDQDSIVRVIVAQILGRWGHQAEAVTALLELLKGRNSYVRLSAAGVLGGWDGQADAVPTLLELLDDQSSMIRVSAAEMLGRWGHQAEALPTLLKYENPDTLPHVVRILGQWGGGCEAANVVLGELIGDDNRAVVEYFEEAEQGTPKPPTTEMAEMLARAIGPKGDDSPRIHALRKVVFHWIWRTVRTSE